MDYPGFHMFQENDIYYIFCQQATCLFEPFKHKLVTFSLFHPVLMEDYSLNLCNNYTNKSSSKRQILIIEAQFEV